MRDRFMISVRRSHELALLQRSVWYTKSQTRDQSALRLRIRDIATGADLGSATSACW
jgi:putative transposase